MRLKRLTGVGCAAPAAGLGLWLSLSGCSGKAPQLLLSADFEQPSSWQGSPHSFSTEQAHSGSISYRLPDGAEFGDTFVAPLGQLSPQLPRRLRVSSWVFLTSGRVRSTMLVTQVLCHGRRPDIWQALSVDQVLPRYRKWEQVEKHLRLPADLRPDDELKIYVWHPESNGEPTYFDDLKVEAWP